jgi:hypothetical protein
MFGLNLPVAERVNRAMQTFLKESLSGSDYAVFA